MAYQPTPTNPVVRPRPAVTVGDAEDWLAEIDAVLAECEQP